MGKIEVRRIHDVERNGRMVSRYEVIYPLPPPSPVYQLTSEVEFARESMKLAQAFEELRLIK